MLKSAGFHIRRSQSPLRPAHPLRPVLWAVPEAKCPQTVVFGADDLPAPPVPKLLDKNTAAPRCLVRFTHAVTPFPHRCLLSAPDRLGSFDWRAANFRDSNSPKSLRDRLTLAPWRVAALHGASSPRAWGLELRRSSFDHSSVCLPYTGSRGCCQPMAAESCAWFGLGALRCQPLTYRLLAMDPKAW